MKKVFVFIVCSLFMMTACSSEDKRSAQDIIKEQFPTSSIYQLPGNTDNHFIVEQDGVFKFARVGNTNSVIIDDTLAPIQLVGIASVIDTPEEWSQITSDSSQPDTLTIWKDSSRHHIQFTGKPR